MRLLLTSNGITSSKIKKEALKLIDKKQNKALIMFTARGHYKKYLRLIKCQLANLGIKRKNIFLADISKKARKPKDIDIFYSCGGNTFYILDRVRKTGFDKIIRKHIKQGKLYIGVSAGSILVHKTIEIAGWGKWRDINDIKLKNLRGLGFTNIAIYPHYRKIMKKTVDEFKRKVKYPVIVMRDRQAVLIVNNKKKFLG